MARIVVESVTDTAEAERRGKPRDDMIYEREVAPGRFVAEIGPFRQYERVVERSTDGALRDETNFSLDVGVWRFLFTRPFKGYLSRRPTKPGSPWWAPPDRLDARPARVLSLLATLSIAAGYVGTLLTQTITFAVDEFDASNSAQGATLAGVRVGILLALVITAAADRQGRRRALIGSMVGSCVFTVLSALAPSLALLGGLQTLSRGCASAAGILITVIAAEEMPPGSRAYAVSLLAMCTGLGAGLALILLPIADVGVTAWRVLYAVPLLFVFPVVRIGGAMPESIRFGVTHEVRARMAGHGRRFWLLAASAFLASIFVAPASQFMNEFLRDEQDFSALGITMFSICTNLPGSIGIVVAGRLADVRGRRMVGAVGMFGGVAFTLLVFLGSGWSIWVWSAIASLVGAATIPALGVYGPELFPTALRGKANGIIGVVGVLGSATGLLVVGRLSETFGRFGPAFALMAIGPAILTVLILVAYPETARQDLEALNPEDRQTGPPTLAGPPTLEGD